MFNEIFVWSVYLNSEGKQQLMGEGVGEGVGLGVFSLKTGRTLV